MNRSHLIKELRTAISFYQELGFSYFPVKKSALEDRLRTLSVTPDKNTVPSNIISTAVLPVISPAESETFTLEEIRQELGECTRCKLSEGRRNIVFGEGNPGAQIMFIGERPRREEDIQGKPFAGEAGKLLTNMIVKLGLKREDMYIADIVKCRPPYSRQPEKEEINSCIPFLKKQIQAVRPRVIVCLGSIAAQTLLLNDLPIEKLRGRFFDFNGIPVMPTYHPVDLIKNPKDKWRTWDDMQKVLGRIT